MCAGGDGAAMREYGDDLTIAAMAVIEKKGRTDKVHVIVDGPTAWA